MRTVYAAVRRQRPKGACNKFLAFLCQIAIVFAFNKTIMDTCDYKLVVEPTESRVARNESDFYTFRIPLKLLQERDQNLLQTVLDTANVAHGHNASGNETVIITCPEGTSAQLQWLVDGLNQFDVQVREQVGTKFVDFSVIKSCELCCVDRRLDDRGVDPVSGVAQLTHAGGALVLHPDLRDEMPVHHVATLRRSIKAAADAHAPVGRLDYHFGAEGGGGCGMYGVLSRASKVVAEKLREPDDVFDMLNRIRDDFGRVLATDCRLTGSVVYGNNDTVAYDLDEQADREALAAERQLVL